MVRGLVHHAFTAVLAAGMVTMSACSGGSSNDGTAAPTPEPTPASATSAAVSTTPAASSTTTTAATTTPTTAASSTAPTTAPPNTTPPSSATPAPLVKTQGPLTSGAGIANATTIDIAGRGYVESEYIFEGEATSYRALGPAPQDGQWTAEPATAEPFRSRMIVRRPTDAAAFSGVVLVEWLNVSSGRDGDPDWGYNHQEITREGHVWVGVSAQAVGVVGGGAVLETPTGASPLIEVDPERYGSLVHPGDAFSFDIFTQAARALTSHDGPAPLDDLIPSTVIAIGESQSATFLTSYVNGVHPIVGLFDGFLLHSRLGSIPSVAGERLGRDGPPTTVRTDLDEPVMIFQAETDLTVLRYFGARQDDTDRIRVWEVAGTAHADAYLLTDVYGLGTGIDPAALLGCTFPLNSGPHHQTVKAALHHLVAWAVDGISPPTSPRLDVRPGATPSDDAVIVRDELGNALGGIRTAPVEVPTATLSGDPVPGATPICSLFGSTEPFDAATLKALYPTHAAYVDAFTAATEAAVTAGHILRPEADTMIAGAAANAIGV